MYLCNRRYRLAGLPGDYQEKNISSPETNYCLLKDLIIWTQYQIQVAAYTGAGLGVYSSPVTEYTLQGGEYKLATQQIGSFFWRFVFKFLIPAGTSQTSAEKRSDMVLKLKDSS